MCISTRSEVWLAQGTRKRRNLHHLSCMFSVALAFFSVGIAKTQQTILRALLLSSFSDINSTITFPEMQTRTNWGSGKSLLTIVRNIQQKNRTLFRAAHVSKVITMGNRLRIAMALARGAYIPCPVHLVVV